MSISGDSVWDRINARLAEMSTAASRRNDPAALAERLAHRARRFRTDSVQADAGEIPLVFLGFHQSKQRYGVPVDDVLEVQTLDQFTPVPQSPHFIRGVVSWRGAILSLVDLGQLCGIPDVGISDTHASIVVEACSHRVALLAGEVEDIYYVPRNQIRRVPIRTAEIPSNWFVGVHDENRLLLRMDTLLQDARFQVCNR